MINTQNDCLLECVTDCNANTCCGQSNQPNSIRMRNGQKNSSKKDSKKETLNNFEDETNGAVNYEQNSDNNNTA